MVKGKPLLGKKKCSEGKRTQMWIIFVGTRPGKKLDADMTEDVTGGMRWL